MALVGPDLASMRGAPIFAPAHFYVERHIEFQRRLGGGGHHLTDYSRGLFFASFGHFEHQFVVDLEQHPHSV